MPIKIIAAIGQNNELGYKGDLCFHLKSDMQFFRNTTISHPILMGKKTFESLKGPLQGRENFVLTHHPSSLPPAFHPVKDLDKFLKKYQSKDSETLFIIGGATLYSAALPYADELILTEIKSACKNSDVFFPKFDKSLYKMTILQKGKENDLEYSFVSYQK